MKKIICLVAALAIGFVLIAQKKPAMPDVNAIIKMSPAELEEYKKKMIEQNSQYAVDFAKKNNLPISEVNLPNLKIEPPKLQVKKLSMIPVKPPTRAELTGELQKSINEVKKLVPSKMVEEVDATVASIPVETLHQEAVMEFYNRDPKKGILLMLQLVNKAPDSMLYVNNLGAVYNLMGAPHRAIPLFQYCLAKYPKSVTALGNIGQSYLALGDMTKAAVYLKKCLDIDSMHTEANHSMGMIHYFKQQFDQAMCFFEREGCATLRSSAFIMGERMGKKFNLRKIAKKKRESLGLLHKDYMEEITNNKFNLPDFPNSVKDLNMRKGDYQAMAAGYAAEQQYWMKKAMDVSNNHAYDADEMPGIYHEQVKDLLDHLGEEFTPEFLSNFYEDDATALQHIIESGTKSLIELKCREAPPGSDLSLQEAYAIKCCEETLRPVADRILNRMGEQISRIYGIGQQRWKDYLNEMVAIAEFDPSPANQMMVYNTVAGYFAYLSTALVYYNSEINNFLPKCVERYDPNDLLRLIESNRKWNLTCPPGLNVQVTMFSVDLKVDCNKFAIEAGENIKGAYEHEFKTHQSTIAIGPGISGDLAGLVTGEVKTQFYLTLDGSLHYEDFGIKRSAELAISGTPVPLVADKIKIGGSLAGVEVSDKISIHSGFSAPEVEWKGGAAAYVQWLQQ